MSIIKLMHGAIYACKYALGLFQEANSYASDVWLILNIKVNAKSIELVMSIMDCLLITKTNRNKRSSNRLLNNSTPSPTKYQNKACLLYYGELIN